MVRLHGCGVKERGKLLQVLAKDPASTVKGNTSHFVLKKIYFLTIEIKHFETASQRYASFLFAQNYSMIKKKIP